MGIWSKYLIVVNNAFKIKQNKRDTYAAIFEDGTGTKAQVLWHSFRSPSFVVMYCKINIYIYMSAVRILTVFLVESIRFS